MNNLEKLKFIANDMFSAFERYQKGECSYDRALEDAGIKFQEHADKRPIVGYVQSGAIKGLLDKIFTKKGIDDESHLYNVQLNSYDIKLIERILKS